MNFSLVDLKNAENETVAESIMKHYTPSDEKYKTYILSILATKKYENLLKKLLPQYDPQKIVLCKLWSKFPLEVKYFILRREMKMKNTFLLRLLLVKHTESFLIKDGGISRKLYAQIFSCRNRNINDDIVTETVKEIMKISS